MSHVLCRCSAMSVDGMTWSWWQRRAQLERGLWIFPDCFFSALLSGDGYGTLFRGFLFRQSAEVVLLLDSVVGAVGVDVFVVLDDKF